ncbi:MAG: amino acid ABC transporter substrate-binding protein [Candidatus Competibacteraceae bacterium]|nr:amino acid ABC transporter substrate-binding protein [Candidatus Competibacteraceae bacterium]
MAATFGLTALTTQDTLAAEALDAIKKRGNIKCGVNTGLPGFSNPDSEGNWTGLDVDVCRAIAAAMFDDPSRVEYVPLSAQQRFTALQSGEIDVLSRNTTWTQTRDTSLGLDFAPVTFYDGQGFMVPKELGVTSAKELDGATVCVQPGTTTELNLADYFRANDMDFQPVVIEKFDEVNNAFFAGRCDVYTTDRSGLAAIRTQLASNPDDYVILPESISKEPLGPAVRHGDNEWFDIVKWTVFAMIEAEELGISSENVDEMLKSDSPSVKRFLGVTPGMGENLGLDDKWAYNIIKHIGNYGEVFQRNVGQPLGLDRGLNALWTEGGLMYAMPIR